MFLNNSKKQSSALSTTLLHCRRRSYERGGWKCNRRKKGGERFGSQKDKITEMPEQKTKRELTRNTKKYYFNNGD